MLHERIPAGIKEWNVKNIELHGKITDFSIEYRSPVFHILKPREKKLDFRIMQTIMRAILFWQPRGIL
jgi:hypothetical protein